MGHVYLVSDSWGVIPIQFFDRHSDAVEYGEQAIKKFNDDNPSCIDVTPELKVAEMTLADALNFILERK